jgi:hypothetical protein
MHEDLAKERKTTTRLWAKREEQIRGVIESTAAIYGDLQGIAGKGLNEIEGLEIGFDFIDGVWVVEPRCALPVALALRQFLIEVAAVRQTNEGQRTKMGLVYQYLTGPRFRAHVEFIVEKFTEMQGDFDKERKAIIRLWAKREEQIRGVIDSTAGMHGDLQGIAGKSFDEIEGLQMTMLPAGEGGGTA